MSALLDRLWQFWDLQFGGQCGGGGHIFSWGHRTILSQRRIQDLERVWQGTKSPRCRSVFIKLYVNFGLFEHDI